MKLTSVNPFLLKQLLAAACITSSAFAAIATKSGTGADLTLGTSWTGGSGPDFPTSDDVATWDTTSLGAGLAADSAVNWGSIEITGALTNIDISGFGLITTGNITLAGSQTLSIANEIDLSGSSIYDIADVTGTMAADATLSGGIYGPAFGLTKTGTGTLVLSGANAFTGPVSVTGGTLQAGVASDAGISGAFGLDTTVSLSNTAGVVLDLGGFNTQIGKLTGGGTTGGTVAVGAATLTIGNGSINVAGAFGGAFTGNGTIFFQGNHTASASTISSVDVTGTNTGFTGQLNVAGARLAVTAQANLGGADIDIGTNGQILALSGTYANNFTIANGNGWLETGGGFGAIRLHSAATLSGTITLNSNTIIGSSSTGTISGAISDGAGSFSLTKNSSGTITLSGANSYSGGTTISGGTLKAGVASVAGISGAFGKNPAVSFSNTAGAVMDITGFDTQVGSLAGGGTTGGNIALGAATLTTGGNDSNTSYAGLISGIGNLTKIGTGTQTLSRANTYTGATTVNAGALLANNTTGSATGAGTVTVKNTATLGGTGLVSGAVILESGGTLAPGAAIGALATGALTLPAGATLAAEINSSGTPAADVVNVTGALTLGGALTVTDIAGVPAALTPGTKLTLVTYSGALTGTFTGKAEGSTFAVGGNTFRIRYADGGNNVTLEAMAGATGYSTWASINAPSQTAAQDYDNDGIPNGVEYVVGGLATANDSAKLPTVSTTTVPGSLVFTFKRSQASKTAGTAVSIQVGTDLAGWPFSYTVGNDTVSSSPEVTVTPNEDGTDTVKLTVTQGADTKKFARLNVVITP